MPANWEATPNWKTLLHHFGGEIMCQPPWANAGSSGLFQGRRKVGVGQEKGRCQEGPWADGWGAGSGSGTWALCQSKPHSPEGCICPELLGSAQLKLAQFQVDALGLLRCYLWYGGKFPHSWIQHKHLGLSVPAQDLVALHASAITELIFKG